MPEAGLTPGDDFLVTVNGTAVEVTRGQHVAAARAAAASSGWPARGSAAASGCAVPASCFSTAAPAPACDTPMWAADGHSRRHRRGPRRPTASLHPRAAGLPRASRRRSAASASPAVLVSAAALLAENPRPDERGVVAALDRNLCRCGDAAHGWSLPCCAPDTGGRLVSLPAHLAAQPASVLLVARRGRRHRHPAHRKGRARPRDPDRAGTDGRRRAGHRAGARSGVAAANTGLGPTRATTAGSNCRSPTRVLRCGMRAPRCGRCFSRGGGSPGSGRSAARPRRS